MWRSSLLFLKQGLLSSRSVIVSKPVTTSRLTRGIYVRPGKIFCDCSLSRDVGRVDVTDGGESRILHEEVNKLMRLVNVDALFGSKEVTGYYEFLKACESTGFVKSDDEAKAFAYALDEARVVLIFRNKVYRHPDKVVDLFRRAVPLALAPDDPRREELKKLQAKQEEIDKLAHKQTRRILWCGLGLLEFQIGLFFRLTYWELSWKVMGPIAFFTTTFCLIVGYAYFLITSTDPTYQDFMKRLFLFRRRKLMKKHNFDVERFLELQNKCKWPLKA
ncbi:hypothetical protein CTI12_AA287220 [Artemisia annua]|uniref:Calcium uniporter protein C-terminal domain-containing protein n=1 Tax=Artemisia annua TaxID=35608 RepID=A0A2U1NAR8_ARTAN|nr:hypothetical protein CTI12_AA287220 [Artemisia annua]